MGQGRICEFVHTSIWFVSCREPRCRVAHNGTACEQLQKISRGTGRTSTEAGEILQWLNEATDDPTNTRVNLQGPSDQYGSWMEVEKYLLPETILKHDNRQDEVDDLAGALQEKAGVNEGSDELSLSSSGTLDQRSKSPSSPRSTRSLGSPKPDLPAIMKMPTPAHSRNGSRQSNGEPSRKMPVAFSTKVPPSLQPLLNFVIWRVNHDHDPSAAFASFILLSNDAVTQSCASKFGIRVKRVEQLRETIKREDREFRDRMQVYNKEVAALKENLATKEREPAQPAATAQDNIAKEANSPTQDAAAKSELTGDTEDDSDIDEVVLKGRGRRSAVKENGGTANPTSNGIPKSADVRTAVTMQHSTPKVLDPNDFGRSTVGTIRGKPALPRGSRNLSPRIASKQSPRTFNQPIDPDLYFRPPPSRDAVRGGRKLWEPT